jgi:hypothetical protein
MMNYDEPKVVGDIEDISRVVDETYFIIRNAHRSSRRWSGRVHDAKVYLIDYLQLKFL